VKDICRFVHAEKANFTIVLLCRVMRTARSACYAWVAGIGARERDARRIRPWLTRSR
jgi:putative transposase